MRVLDMLVMLVVVGRRGEAVEQEEQGGLVSCPGREGGGWRACPGREEHCISQSQVRGWTGGTWTG